MWMRFWSIKGNKTGCTDSCLDIIAKNIAEGNFKKFIDVHNVLWSNESQVFRFARFFLCMAINLTLWEMTQRIKERFLNQPSRDKMKFIDFIIIQKLVDFLLVLLLFIFKCTINLELESIVVYQHGKNSLFIFIYRTDVWNKLRRKLSPTIHGRATI